MKRGDSDENNIMARRTAKIISIFFVTAVALCNTYFNSKHIDAIRGSNDVIFSAETNLVAPAKVDASENTTIVSSVVKESHATPPETLTPPADFKQDEGKTPPDSSNEVTIATDTNLVAPANLDASENTTIGLSVVKESHTTPPETLTPPADFKQDEGETPPDLSNEVTIATDTNLIAPSENTTIGSSVAEESPAMPPETLTPPSDFKRFEGVVIATKIHGENQLILLEQSLCLLHFAYNHKVLYDIVVFMTEDNIPQERKESIQAMIAPSKVTFVQDNIGFHEMIETFTPQKREAFLGRCDTNSSAELSWWSHCDWTHRAKIGQKSRIAYNWQAEFRSLHIWNHPALDPYKTMLWIDSDAFASKPWEEDPIQFFIENDAVILFDNFPAGTEARDYILDDISTAFGHSTIADLRLNEAKGHLERTLINRTEFQQIRQRGRLKIREIYGFLHITNLDFYRQPVVLDGLKALIGDCFVCRVPDDQLSVTIPAALFAPERSFDMRSNGIHLGVFHNGKYDGRFKAPKMNFVKLWKGGNKDNFPPIVSETCPITAAHRRG